MGGNCSTIQVQSGDSCGTLTTRCGINATDFYDYNPASDLCSTLQVGQHVCCTAGTMPDYTPQENANGTCSSYLVQSGDSCSELGASYNLTLAQIESFNTETWGWLGCSDLQAGENICLSPGTPPFPVSLANAVCGPQVPGTAASNLSSTEWASLNPCPLNACCDIWGQCGVTFEFCTVSNSSTGSPGTAATGSNGCISNCGVIMENNANPPAEFAAVGYFEAFNVQQRSCLNMYPYNIDESKYTHIHYAFGNITSDFDVNDGGYSDMFQLFSTQLTQVKRIMSFGGWAFSTDPSTYMIFREGVTEANRDTLVQNVVNFIVSNDLDGVDFDWEYPGEPDILGIPAGSTEDGGNYFAFLSELRQSLPSGKTISVAAPASYWYLQGFPIADIAAVVDYIVFMTYDLHGTWDMGNQWSQDGCPAGNCLRSDINSTETLFALSMISKAGVPTNKIMVGVTSYGRSFTMSTAGCTGPECTWTTAGLAGECTNTAGLIANAEINQIIATNPTAQQIHDVASDSDILVYNETQWVGYMADANKAARQQAYQENNMGGTSDWAIDLIQFYPDVGDIDLSDYGYSYTAADCPCFEPDLPDVTDDQVSQFILCGASYIDVLFTNYLTSTNKWPEAMTSKTGIVVNCNSFPASGLCVNLDYNQCSSYAPGLFQAQWMVSILYDNLVIWYNMFVLAGQEGTLDLSNVTTTFPPYTPPSQTSLAAILSMLGSAIGAGGGMVGALPLSDIEEIADPEAGAIIGAGISVVGAILSIIGSALPSSSTTSDPSLALELDTLAMINNTFQGMVTLATNVFTKGDVSSFPAEVTTGPYTTALANFFYQGQFISTYSATQSEAIQNALFSSIRQGMVGQTLVQGDYFLSQAAVDPADCTSVPSGTLFDGVCYVLELPGTSCASQKPQSVGVTSDFVNNLPAFGVDMVDMINSSVQCQSQTNDYLGTLPTTFDLQTFSANPHPPCFYNLPVLNMEDSTDGSASEGLISPCVIYTKNVTAGEQQVLGQTWLPPNLNSIYTEAFCDGCVTVCRRGSKRTVC